MSAHSAPIVVGYDGSPSSLGAVRWAAAEAVREHAPLRIAEAFELVLTTRPSPGTVVPLDALRTTRQKGLDAIAETVRLEHHGLNVDTYLGTGPAASELLETAEHARLIVLGSRGLGGWGGLLVGSVAVQVATHAHCPVVVLPHELRSQTHNAGTVVVGVDGSKSSAKAIEFAFDQADTLNAHVVALHTWTSPFLTYADGASMLAFDVKEIKEEARLLVAEAVAGAAADHPDVSWTTELVNGSAAQALARRSETADLVVVGSRGRGGFTGLLLGSVSQAVLHHAHCPIAIVR
ncbi:universal stress protein [Kribbella sp. NPDC020789]